MLKVIAFYNHKGGVSKTTTTFNFAHYVSKIKNKRVLVIDADPQCNITEILLTNLINDLDAESERTGKIVDLPGTSILDIMSPRIEGSVPIVDITKIEEVKINSNLSIIRGDVSLSKIEDSLAEAYIQRFSTKIHEKRNYVAFNDFIQRYGNANNYDYVFIDVGPSSGSLTRTCVLSCDGFFIPLNPDRFSIQAIKTLSVILSRWFSDHKQIIPDFQKLDLPIKVTLPRLLGAIPQLYKKYKGKPKPGYDLWMKRVPSTIFEDLVPQLSSIDKNIIEKISLDNVVVTEISDFGSLSPCSQELGKPIFDISQDDTKVVYNGTPWTGATWKDAQARMEVFKSDYEKIWERLQWI